MHFTTLSDAPWTQGVQNEGIHNQYHSLNLIRLITSTRLSWAGHVVRMKEGRSAFTILAGKPKGKRPLGVDRKTILERTLKK